MRRLGAKRETAAQLVAEDRLTDEKIAESLGVSRKTLHVWKQHPAFSARVTELESIWTNRALKNNLARREYRLAVLADQHGRCLAIRDARASDPSMADVPGGATGMLVRTYKGLGNGENARVVEEYAYDAALDREIRELQAQCAEELGQVQPMQVEVARKKNWHSTEELEAELVMLLAKRNSKQPEDAPC
jgi:hypothetical protein